MAWTCFPGTQALSLDRHLMRISIRLLDYTESAQVEPRMLTRIIISNAAHWADVMMRMRAHLLWIGHARTHQEVRKSGNTERSYWQWVQRWTSSSTRMHFVMIRLYCGQVCQALPSGPCGTLSGWWIVMGREGDPAHGGGSEDAAPSCPSAPSLAVTQRAALRSLFINLYSSTYLEPSLITAFIHAPRCPSLSSTSIRATCACPPAPSAPFESTTTSHRLIKKPATCVPSGNNSPCSFAFTFLRAT